MTADVWIENIIMIGQGVLFVLLALFYVKKPPAKINNLYGYRTRRSMKNQDIWKAANAYSSKSFLSIAILVLVIGIALCFFDFNLRVLLQLSILLLGLGYSVWQTEVYLNTHFDKDGNPKL